MNRTALSLALLSALCSFTAQASDLKYVDPETVAHLPGLSQAVIVPAAKLVFVSGQVPLTSKGELVGIGDFRAQAKQTFENVRAVLTAAGTSTAKIVKINYYVVDLDDSKRNILREVRGEYMDPQRSPASTLAGVQRLFRADVQLEIDVVASLP
jgi:enamine deaminase RidA (YjgF/YER057c/UK114 family)